MPGLTRGTCMHSRLALADEVQPVLRRITTAKIAQAGGKKKLVGCMLESRPMAQSGEKHGVSGGPP